MLSHTIGRTSMCCKSTGSQRVPPFSLIMSIPETANYPSMVSGVFIGQRHRKNSLSISTILILMTQNGIYSLYPATGK